MQVKIDTKEKFHVLSVNASILSDNIAAELAQVANNFLQQEIKNVVLKLDNITSMDDAVAEQIARLQQSFYENNASFVICCLQSPVEEQLDKIELLEVMNITPTESEAWDIVQMEEIERELMDDGDASFPSQNS